MVQCPLSIYIENFLILRHLYIETPSSMQSPKRYRIELEHLMSELFHIICLDILFCVSLCFIYTMQSEYLLKMHCFYI